ncbi:uncharacterized protein LOC115412079 [Sphaeramia orbicularis]|uniref:uncharacterized protein LOC115412079 n=1 Tax=Sphaeramia orbicularis TaxID=375764 RepID=UPI001180839E|nr:uncharacterized protein LOC115412079 [Sphaeramia orbicularis]
MTDRILKVVRTSLSRHETDRRHSEFLFYTKEENHRIWKMETKGHTGKGVDVLLPVLCIMDRGVPSDRQQCVLKASKEAKVAKALQMDATASNPKKAYEEAEKRCHLVGATAPTKVQILGQLILSFGKYCGRTFKWLIENDVGYVKYLLDRHVKERRQAGRREDTPEWWLKEQLLAYAQLFPSVSCHLEINVDRAIYGQGRFRSFTFLEMWQWYSLHKTLLADPQAGSDHERKMAQEAYCSVRQWLIMKEDDISSKSLKRFRLYILMKEEEQSSHQAAPSSSEKQAPATSAAERAEDTWGDDAPLVEALSTFEQTAAVRPTQDPGKPSGMGESPVERPQPQPPQPPPPAAAAVRPTQDPGKPSGMGESPVERPQPQPPQPPPPAAAAVRPTQDPDKPSGMGESPVERPQPPQPPPPAAAVHIKHREKSRAGKKRQPFAVSARDKLSTPGTEPDVVVGPAQLTDSTVGQPLGAERREPSPEPAGESGSVASRDDLSSDPAQVSLEGWHKAWETPPHGLPPADVKWLKEDSQRGLFQAEVLYRDKYSKVRKRRVLKDDRMWFFPPEPPGLVRGGIPSADAFFHARVFFWRPVGVWGYSLRCTRSKCPARTKKDVFLYRCGYSKTVRQICDLSGWYTMLTEVLACNECRKAAKASEEHTLGRIPAWDAAILRQLTPAHRAVFPAVLTPMRGVDKQVIHLMRDRTEGNTMTKVWRQVQENHCEEYLQRKDLYTTLLSQVCQPGGIVRSLGHRFQDPPPRRELPSPKLLRKAYLIAEADNVEDYRTQIMSTFGKVLKYDSTKKICKKLSGDGKGTAEWCTNVGNEMGQVLTSVITCEESLDKLLPMARGLTERYRRAGEPAPELMYVDRGCCRKQGVSSVEQLFQEWTDSGMMVRLDIFHWIHRFDAALRTDHHSKYALFKSALSAAVFAYNKDDVALLLQAVRAGHPTRYASVTDAEMLQTHVTKHDLKHYVRRITVGAQVTFTRAQAAIDVLKGPAGLDENGVPLFKDGDAIDRVWENQQKHLECIQDPPGRNMYVITKYVMRNGVRLARYRTVRGSNSLEGFHSFLPSFIPGPHCAAVPFQVYLLSGIARWNADREAACVRGQKGRRYRVYVSPLIDRLNRRCQEMFGRVEEENYIPPVPPGDELIGLEYLFSQSSADFSVQGHYTETRETIQEEEEEEEEEERAATSDTDVPEEEGEDPGYATDGEGDALAPLRSSLCLTELTVASELDPCAEDVCGPNHLPGYQHVEELSRVLVEIALEEGKLALTESTRQRVIGAWNQLDLHDRSIQQFDSLYSARWGNALFGRTSGDPSDASLVQRIKFGKRFAAAHLLDSRKNRLMYCVIKNLWLHPQCAAKRQGTPAKQLVTKLYQRVQQRVTVDDPVLRKLGIPILKVNSKCVGEFIRRQEALSATNVTDQGLSILRRTQSIASTSQPPAEELPDVRPQTSRPQLQYVIPASLAGTRELKRRRDASLPKPIATPALSAATTTAAATTTPALSAAATTAAATATPAHSATSAAASARQPPTTHTRLPGSASHISTAAARPLPASQSHLLSAHSSQPLAPTPPTPLHHPARSTLYKSKKRPLNFDTRAVSKIYACSLCGKSTQGHKRYRKKTYCQTTNMSASQGFTGRTFESFTDFQEAVDEALRTQPPEN